MDRMLDTIKSSITLSSGFTQSSASRYLRANTSSLMG